MVIFSAYFDASGHPDEHDVLTVAGYAATVDNWIKFECRWKEVLQSEGVTSFHTTDFVSGGGEFKDWKGKEPEKVGRRRRFVARLMKCVDDHCAKFFRSSLFIPDYNKVNEEFKLSEFLGQPYAVACALATYRLREWAGELGVLDTLLYYYEDGDKDKGDWERIHRTLYGRNPRFLDKKDTVAFEAADFNAWKMRTALHESNKPTHTPEIGKNLFRSLAVLENVSKEGGVLNEWSFRTFCEMNGIEKR